MLNIPSSLCIDLCLYIELAGSFFFFLSFLQWFHSHVYFTTSLCFKIFFHLFSSFSLRKPGSCISFNWSYNFCFVSSVCSWKVLNCCFGLNTCLSKSKCRSCIETLFSLLNSRENLPDTGAGWTVWKKLDCFSDTVPTICGNPVYCFMICFMCLEGDSLWNRLNSIFLLSV